MYPKGPLALKKNSVDNRCDAYSGQTSFYRYPRKNIDEVIFWRPGSTAFHALMPNDLFLFKLKKPYYAIVGGGFFVSYSSVPIDLAWKAFGEKNGTKGYQEFRKRITAYREKNHIDAALPHIGCIILTQPFFFPESQWITQPNDWPTSSMSGKKYYSAFGEGARIYQQVMDRLSYQLALP